jgi:hypothetical protein
MYTCQLIIYMYNLQSTKPTPLQSHFPFQSEEKFVCKKGDNQYFIGVSWPDQHNSPIINANEAKCEDWLKLMDTYEKILFRILQCSIYSTIFKRWRIVIAVAGKYYTPILFTGYDSIIFGSSQSLTVYNFLQLLTVYHFLQLLTVYHFLQLLTVYHFLQLLTVYHFLHDWLIDWLIDWCLTSSEQFFSYIQDENI